VTSVAWTPAQLARIATDTVIQGSFAGDWWQQQADSLQARFQQQMQLGQLRGETINDLVQRVRGTQALGFTDGIMTTSTNQASTLVRTSALGVSNQARMDTYSANDSVIKGVQWHATLDPRTCPICIALDGAAWNYPDGDGKADYADYEPVHHDKEFTPPPAHWNCRCVVIPITKSWQELAGAHGNSAAAAAADAVPTGERSSMDGQVADTMTFDEWLTGKDEAFQNDVLGPTRAEAWRNGQLDLAGLTDQANNPLTIAQLDLPGAAAAREAVPPRPWIDHLEGMPFAEVDGKPFGTDQLYRDASGTLTPERAAFRADEVSAAFKGVTPVPSDETPLAVLMIGGTASGKSTIVNEVMSKDLNFVRVDADAIKFDIPEYKASIKASARDAAAIVHEESSQIAGDIRNGAIAGNYNVFVDATGANAEKYRLLINSLKEKGYEVHIIGIGNDVEQAIIRSAARAERTGRWVPEGFIRETYGRIPASFETNSALADRFMLFDNSGDAPKLAWQLDENGEQIFDQEYAAGYGA
jgi:SPP1 gp7 family putative phage head morphogenesis protein